MSIILNCPNLLRHARTGKDCSGLMLVSRNKKDLIGYIGWQGDMIIALEVSEDYRGLGYGDYLLKKAINSGCTKLTVSEKNLRAINLYQKNGFKIINKTGSRFLMRL